jgi:hypothetical protein
MLLSVAGVGLVAVLWLGIHLVTRPATEPSKQGPIASQHSLDVANQRNPSAWHVGMLPQPPKLAPIADQVVDEDKSFQIPVQLENKDQAGSPLRFNLAADAPPGARLDSRTGLFFWTPSKEQGPGNFAITVQVSGPGNLTDTVSFRVTVRGAK